ncbi:MAG: twin transmembrane helix small protein [Chromatiales bacterium]
MAFKVIVIAVLAAILLSLGSALFYLVRDRGQDERTVKSLTVRIALSVALFFLLMIAAFMGWITPHGIRP